MRPSKEKYYLNIAKEVASRANCIRAKVGAIIIKDDQLIASGYNGAPRKTKDCMEKGFCLRDRMNIPHGQRYELCCSCHGEQNAIINAARAGVSLLEGDIFIYGENKQGQRVDAFPCFICKKMLVNAGLNRVVCSTKDRGMKIFFVADWVKEWQEKDIIDDKHQYGKDQKN